MTIPLKLAIASLIVGTLMGLLVLGAASAAGRKRRFPFLVAGAAWGISVVGLTLTDCLHTGGPGPVSEAAFPIFFTGVLLFPVWMAWRQQRWYLRWLYAQVVMLISLVPGFVVAITAALCTFT